MGRISSSAPQFTKMTSWVSASALTRVAQDHGPHAVPDSATDAPTLIRLPSPLGRSHDFHKVKIPYSIHRQRLQGSASTAKRNESTQCTRDDHPGGSPATSAPSPAPSPMSRYLTLHGMQMPGNRSDMATGSRETLLTLFPQAASCVIKTAPLTSFCPRFGQPLLPGLHHRVSLELRTLSVKAP
jgi:hypothetical protein